MGSIQNLSILKGQTEPLRRKDEPIKLHRIIEQTIKGIESINSNNDIFPTVHGIVLLAGNPEVIFGNTRISLSEINQSANQLARAVQTKFTAIANSDGDTVIAVEIPPSPELLVALLAIWKLGAAYLPLDVSFPDQRVHHILQESQPSLVITTRTDYDQRYAKSPIAEYSHLKSISEALSIEDLPEELSWAEQVQEDSQLAIILYTSGSTGVPKGVRLPHRVILNRLKWQWKTFPYSDSEKVSVFKTALTFVDSVAELWGPLLWGRSVLILSKNDIIDTENFIALLDNNKIERLILVPTLLRSMLLYLEMVSNGKNPFRPNETMQSHKYLTNLKLCISSGEVLFVTLAQKFYQYFPSDRHLLLNFYGSTEVMGDVLFHPVTGVETLSYGDKIPIGRPLDNTNIYILDKSLRPVNTGEVGELFVSGLNLATGYVKGRDPQRFIDNPLAVDPAHAKMYRTGDYAVVIDGIVYYEGRTDSQIKIRGHKVDLSEVEGALAKVAEVNISVVLCYNARKIDQALLAFVTTKEPNFQARTIEEELERYLPPYMVPQVVVVPAIPLLVNGKVDIQFLLEQYEENSNRDTREYVDFDYSGLTNGSYRKAKALFETVALTLGHSLKEKINSNSNFYHLGGNSLNSILVVTKLRDLGYLISIGEFITAKSMLDIVLRMHEEEATIGVSLDSLNQIPDGKYTTEMLADRHKEDTISIITGSFYEKADLTQWLTAVISKEDYEDVINAIWEPYVKQQLSFVVKNIEGTVIGVSMNIDAHAEPEVTITSKLTIILEFTEFIEGYFRDNVLPKGTGQVMHSIIMGTAAFVTPQQNIELMLYMEQENIKLARKCGFAGIFTTNTSPLTQQLGTDVLEYKVLNNFQINKYVAPDGTKPFGEAPNTDRAVVFWKEI